nr:VOC family protein [Paenibacillus hemerocallicola]
MSQNGQVYMPLGEYPFSRKFGWVGDKFGVTWQLTQASNDQ